MDCDIDSGVEESSKYVEYRAEEKLEDEDMLRWSQALDYEGYSSSWNRIGVSMASEMKYDDMYRTASMREALEAELDYRK